MFSQNYKIAENFPRNSKINVENIPTFKIFFGALEYSLETIDAVLITGTLI